MRGVCGDIMPYLKAKSDNILLKAFISVGCSVIEESGC